MELIARRQSASSPSAPPEKASGLHPLRRSPYRTYAHYATRLLSDDVTFVLAVEQPLVRLEELMTSAMNNFADATLAPRERRKAFIKRLQKGPATIAAMLA